MIMVLETLGYGRRCSPAVPAAVTSLVPVWGTLGATAEGAVSSRHSHPGGGQIPLVTASGRIPSFCLSLSVPSPLLLILLYVLHLFAQICLHSWVHFLYIIGQLILFIPYNILRLSFYFCKRCAISFSLSSGCWRVFH